jgi:hypothetical protein
MGFNVDLPILCSFWPNVFVQEVPVKHDAARARPDLAAHQVAMRSGTDELISQLVRILGARLVAYIAGVSETRAVRQWMEGKRTPHSDSVVRLREALVVAKMIETHDSAATAQAWFMGLNPQLDDRSPARMLRDGDDDALAMVRGAARAFLVGG